MDLLVNGERITAAAMRAEAARLRAQAGPEVDPFEAGRISREAAREQLIDRVLIRQEAVRDTRPIAPELVEEALRKLGTDASCRALPNEDRRREAELRLRVDRLMERWTAAAKPPRPDEVARIYKHEGAMFWEPESVRVAHLVRQVDRPEDDAAAQAVVAEAIRRLDAGEAFAAVAAALSDCPANGGELDWFARGAMVPEFEQAVWPLRVGERTAPFRTAFGWHVAVKTGHKPEGIPPLQEVREAIRQLVLVQRMEEIVSRKVDELRRQAAILEVK